MNNLKSAGPLSIGALAKRAGMNVSAIRYYEEIGLIPAAQRRPSGHRTYPADLEDLLTLIRHCREFGFSVEETRALVSLSTSKGRDCVQARDIAALHLQAMRKKLAELQSLERTLARFVQSCTAECAGGPAPECTIFKDLSAGANEPQVAAGSRCCG